MNYLLKAGANPRTPIRGGWIPLSCAIEENRIDLIKSLLNAGASLDEGYINNNTPLLIAIDKGHLAGQKHE